MMYDQLPSVVQIVYGILCSFIIHMGIPDGALLIKEPPFRPQRGCLLEAEVGSEGWTCLAVISYQMHQPIALISSEDPYCWPAEIKTTTTVRPNTG